MPSPQPLPAAGTQTLLQVEKVLAANSKCPRCGGPALELFTSSECLNKCKPRPVQTSYFPAGRKSLEPFWVAYLGPKPTPPELSTQYYLMKKGGPCAFGFGLTEDAAIADFFKRERDKRFEK